MMRAQKQATWFCEARFGMFIHWVEYSLPGFKQKLKGARFLASGKRIEAIQESHRIILKGMLGEAPSLCPVVELLFDALPEPVPLAKKRLWGKNLTGMEEWAVL